MQFTFTGNNPNFLAQSFFDQNGALSVNVLSAAPTEVVLSHTVFVAANVTVVLRGSGLSVDAFGNLASGTITSFEFNGLNIRQATVSEITWDAVSFQNALFDIADFGDYTGIGALFNANGPISIGASDALAGFDQELAWGDFLPFVTQPITFVGSQFDDSVLGSFGNDIISTGSSVNNGDRIAASLGNDRIIFDLPDNSQSPGYYLDYDRIASGVTFDVDGITNTGTASGAGFVDTFENVQDALGTYFGIEGTVGDDIYNIRLAPDQVFSVIGGSGSDSYTLDAAGAQPILDYFFTSVTSGIDLNVGTGVVANDGFGFVDQLDFVGLPETLIILSTDASDRVVDGAGDQLIRFYEGDDVFEASLLGNDSIDGGNGTDSIVFDTLTQGRMTVMFDSGIAAVTDRANPTGTVELLAVENIQTSDNAVFQLANHDGIGLISAEDLTTLTELYIAYFNRAADALGLSFWATAFQKNGFSLREIADLFFDQPETQSLYAGATAGAFVQEVYNNVLGRNADQAGFDFWTGQLALGNVTESGFILELLAGARAATGDPADVAFIETKTDIGLYFAVTQGQSDVAAARNVMEAFDGTQGGIANAISLSDQAFGNALASDDTVLLQTVGVIDSPFDGIA